MLHNDPGALPNTTRSQSHPPLASRLIETSPQRSPPPQVGVPPEQALPDANFGAPCIKIRDAAVDRNGSSNGHSTALPPSTCSDSYALDFSNTAPAFAGRSDYDLQKSRRLFSLMARPTLSSIGEHVIRGALWLHVPLAKGIIRDTLFQQFCGGETIDQATSRAQQLAASGVRSILDFAVEGEKSEEGFDASLRELMRILESARTTPHISYTAVKITSIGDFDVLAKAQQGPLMRIEQESLHRTKERLFGLAAFAEKHGLRLFIDAEESWIQKTIDNMTLEAMRQFNKHSAVVNTTIQLYRTDRLSYLEGLIESAAREGFILGLKTVRGAYLSKERARAEELGIPSPIQPDKAATDEAYNQAVELCLRNIDHVALCVASHNEKSCRHAAAIMEQRGIPKDSPRVHFAQLLGMSDNISFNLAAAGFNVSKYVPYGPLERVMPYLFRRAKENGSVKGQTPRELTFVEHEITRRASLASQ